MTAQSFRNTVAALAVFIALVILVGILARV